MADKIKNLSNLKQRRPFAAGFRKVLLLTPGSVYFAAIFAPFFYCLTVFAAPSWWTKGGIIQTNTPANDYAAVNAGQLKYVAQQAYLEMEDVLPGGAGGDVSNLIRGFEMNAGNDYMAISIGQLKYVAKKFYDRLGYAYPWTTTTTKDDQDYALVNIGQLKNAFNFEIPCPKTGMWVWDQTILDDSSSTDSNSKVERLKNFCVEYGIDTVAFSINWTAEFDTPVNKKKVRNLLFKLHRENINVEVLFGAADWVRNSVNYDFGIQLMDRVVRFQESQKNDPLRRFDGILRYASRLPSNH